MCNKYFVTIYYRMSNKVNKSRAEYMREYRQKKKDQPEEEKPNKFEMSAKRLAAIERMKKARQAKFNKKKVIDLTNDDEDSDQTDSELNYPIPPPKHSKEVIDLTIDTEDEQDEEDKNMELATKIVQEQQDEEIKKDSQLLQVDDNIADLREYMQTSGLVEHIKQLEEELKETRELLDKTNETLKLVTMSNAKKSKKIKRLKKIPYDPENLGEIFDHKKIKIIMPDPLKDDNEEFFNDDEKDELKILNDDQWNELDRLFTEFKDKFHQHYKEHHNLVDKE